MAAPESKMTTSNAASNIDPGSGFCSETRIFHSLRPKTPMPPSSRPLSITQYALSLLQTTPTAANLPTTPFLIDSATGHSLSYSQFLSQSHSLCLSLQRRFSLNKNDVAFIIAPPSFAVPVLYLSLLSLGVTVCPANPLGSSSEVAHQLQLTKPKIAFATSQTARSIPHLPFGTVLIDSPEFLFWLVQPHDFPRSPVAVNQTDSAAILFSSGTTGKVKGVVLTHNNLIALISGIYHNKLEPDPSIPLPHPVSLIPIPLFHVFGFVMLIRTIWNGETLVLMERFDFAEMLKAVEKYKVTFMPVAPPLVVAFVKSDLTKKFDLSSLITLGSGGARLGEEVAEKFKDKFPNVQISQGYSLTETAGGSRTMGPEEMQNYASVGRLNENMEARIVDPETGEALPPGQKGELWLRGPTIMKGYVGDAKATAETLDSEGWLKTGDLCYFDAKGFLYIIDRLKELIKYKGYQVPPADLEPLLQSNPEIADAAVIPYPDEEAGQIPMAYVVRKPGSNISEAQIIDYIAKQVAPYKKIRRVAFTNAIPKSPAGKILRRELVNHALSGASSKL